MLLLVTTVLLALIGLALLAGGVFLVALGGSPAYALIGVGFLATAFLVHRRRPSALGLYGLMTLAALGWAVWEVGLDWWQLAPRGGVIIVLGLWLLTPWVRRRLDAGPVPGRRAPAWPIAVPLVVAIATAVYAMAIDPHDTPGSLPDARLAEANLGGAIPDGEWHQYGRTQYGQRFSPLDQITPANVSNLKVAWQYQTGDVKLPDDVAETTYQVTPLKVGDTLYLCTPHNWAIAVDAKTGQERWKFDPNVGLNPDRQHQTCRGVTYWSDPNAAADAACAARVYLPTSDARLIALDAKTGAVCESFADRGTLNLGQGMRYNPAGFYYSTSPPVAVGDRIIVGGAVNDNYSLKAQSGVIRAFDIRTGELLWNWDSGNPDQTAPLPPGETYTTNSPNSWSVFSADPDLGLVYIPLGNQVPDQIGIGRSKNVERFSSSIVALDIATGQLRWVRQTVHHDLWDMDVPAQPVLFDMRRPDGTVIPALVGPTKQGDIYVLDRRSGQPIIPIREEPAPGRGDPGRLHVADAADLEPYLLAAAADRGEHVGHDAVRPARLPHRVPPVPLRGPLHAAFARRHDRLSREFRHVQLGQRRGRSRTADHVRHADLSGLHLAARPRRRYAAQGRREGERAGPQPQRGRGLRRLYGAVPEPARHSLPGAAMGLCRRRRSGDRHDGLAAQERHRHGHDAAAASVQARRARHRRAAPDARRRRLPGGRSRQLSARL